MISRLEFDVKNTVSLNNVFSIINKIKNEIGENIKDVDSWDGEYQFIFDNMKIVYAPPNAIYNKNIIKIIINSDNSLELISKASLIIQPLINV